MKQSTAFLLAMIMIATSFSAFSGATSDVVQPLAKDSASSGVLPAASSGVQGPSGVPEGVSGGDWNDILALYQEARYYLTWHDPSSGYVASNPNNGWYTTFKDGGARVTASGWSWTISPTSYGYEESLILLDTAPSTVAGKNRISDAFSEDFTAWYINDERGLEHGFDIAAPPKKGAGPLVINIALETGLTPAVYPGGIGFLDRNGEAALDYAKLLVTDSAGAELPAELSMSADRHTITISMDDTNAAYPITIDPIITTPVKKLTASDGAANDLFGVAVAVSGDTIVVGAYGDDVSRGSAYVFTRNNGSAENWGQVKKLVASDGVANDLFGAAVAISGDTIVVGAFGDDGSQGSAYVFTRNNGGADNWGQVKKIIASDGAAFEYFGYSVSVSGDTIVVGAVSNKVMGVYLGAAYVFTRNNGGADNWGLVKKITASDGAAYDGFGAAVAVSGDTIVVGADRNDVDGVDTGSAYVFTRNNGGADNWGQVKQIAAIDRDANDYFGSSVSVSGDTIVVGAPNNWEGAHSYQGSAYVFTRNYGGADNWGLVTNITASDGAANDYFGRSVSVSGDTIVVGISSDDVVGIDQGSACVFTRNNGGADNWGQVKKLTASDGAAGDNFGRSVSVSGDTIVVGASNDVVGANSYQGSAYIYYLDFIPTTITTVDDVTATMDTLYSVDYDATSPNAEDTLTWSLTTSAPWLSIIPSTGVLSGTPGSSHLGTYWVNVSVSDGNGGTDWTNFTLTVNMAPINLEAGWNLISIPLEMANASVENVLASISGMWDVVKYYDASDAMDPWKTFRVGGTANDLAFIDRTMGVWVHATDSCSLEVYGTVHASTDIVLHAGWNLVGYPTQTTQMVGLALWGTGADIIEVFDPVSPYIKEVGGTYLMKPGEGYWIHVTADSTWTINW